VLMYIFGLVYAMTIGAQATPPTVPAGAVLLVISGAWIAAWSALSRPSAHAVGLRGRPVCLLTDPADITLLEERDYGA
jgi:hypothetical protein